MRLNRWAVLAVAAGAVGVALGTTFGPAAEKPGKPGVMKRKLAHSQKLLEGLAVHDFELIRKEAEALDGVSREAGWQAVRTVRYELYSNDFRQALGDMAKHAKAKNIDGAALAYVDMTLTCVKCHKHIREEKMGRLDAPDRGDRIASRDR